MISGDSTGRRLDRNLLFADLVWILLFSRVEGRDNHRGGHRLYAGEALKRKPHGEITWCIGDGMSGESHTIMGPRHMLVDDTVFPPRFLDR